MLKRLGSVAIVLQASVLAVLLLAPEVHALYREGWAGVTGYSVEAESIPESHTTSPPPPVGVPIITSFTPLSGVPLSYVQLAGANFVDVTSVTFGGVPAATFLFFPNSGIAQVPLGALTGPISVTNAFGTAVSHDNFNIAPLVIGGRNLRASFPSSGSVSGPFELLWDNGGGPFSYHVVRADLSSGSPPTSIGPLPSSSYHDDDATPGNLYCYLVVTVFGTTVLGTSDLECGESGIRIGAVVPDFFSLYLQQSDTAFLSWARPRTGDADAYVVGIVPLTGAPSSQVVFPPGMFFYAHDTGGAPTCFLVAGLKLGPPFAYGLTNLLCGVPGFSTLGEAAALEVTAEQMAERVQEGLAGLKLPDLERTLTAAAERALQVGE